MLPIVIRRTQVTSKLKLLYFSCCSTHSIRILNSHLYSIDILTDKGTVITSYYLNKFLSSKAKTKIRQQIDSARKVCGGIVTILLQLVEYGKGEEREMGTTIAVRIKHKPTIRTSQIVGTTVKYQYAGY